MVAWPADTKSKQIVAAYPFIGNKLFGQHLDKVVVEMRDKKKVLPKSLHPAERKGHLTTIPFILLFNLQGQERIVDVRHGHLGRGFDEPSTTPEKTGPGSHVTRTARSVRGDQPHGNKPRHDSRVLPVGGRLTHFFPQWASTTSDEWSIEIVLHGYSIEFFKLPPERFLHSPPGHSRQKRRIMLQAVLVI